MHFSGGSKRWPFQSAWHSWKPSEKFCHLGFYNKFNLDSEQAAPGRTRSVWPDVFIYLVTIFQPFFLSLSCSSCFFPLAVPSLQVTSRFLWSNVSTVAICNYWPHRSALCVLLQTASTSFGTRHALGRRRPSLRLVLLCVSLLRIKSLPVLPSSSKKRVIIAVFSIKSEYL